MGERIGKRYLTPDECRDIGKEPYAIYGGKVYSFWSGASLVAHGSADYEHAVMIADEHLARAQGKG